MNTEERPMAEQQQKKRSLQNEQQQPPPPTKRRSFPSYQDVPNLPPKIKLLSEIVATTASAAVEAVLDKIGLHVTQADVEQVLKVSYSFPGPSVKFFRWAGLQLNDNLSPYAWNLVVDLLGKNCLFEAMWDAIKSMKREGLVSLATFASVFGSYVAADKVKEAIKTFEVMGQYGVTCNVIALNSLLSAICRDGKTQDALDVLLIAKDSNSIRPDGDSYAILLEGWEKEINVVSARAVFAEMVNEIGWDPGNLPAYDSFLCTLLVGRDGVNEVIKVLKTMIDRRCFPGMKFFAAALKECLKQNDVKGAELIWEAMVVRVGFRPDTHLYNLMIALYCHGNNIDAAKKIFHGMVYNGAFPDAQTYNVLFQFLIKGRKLKEASFLFNEMVKNEFVPNQANCTAAIRVYINNDDPYMAIKVWKCMTENYGADLEETGNLLVVGLQDLHMIPEAVKYAEGMIERGIKLNSSSVSKLKESLTADNKGFVYEELLRKWKARS